MSRFIPTYVGHTGKTNTENQRIAVHPHIRGAYGWRPRMRRIPTVHPHIRGAYNSVLGSILLDAVHPHIRGAYDRGAVSLFFFCGSSPHTWGIRFPTALRIRPSRFIPTYVGHTVSSRFSIVLPPVHPHIRGAYPAALGEGLGLCGSSPHTWGILIGGEVLQGAARFIPTYVGHTAICFCVSVRMNGSSPHTWGILLPSAVTAALLPVHPHIRGAYLLPQSYNQRRTGSSPHTWGILRLTSSVSTYFRFIPTYVGHTQK